jgi:hypothetical protein
VNVTDGYTWTNETYDFTVRSRLSPDDLTPPVGTEAITINRTAINVSWEPNNDRTIVERNTTETWDRGQGTEIYNGSATYYIDFGLEDNTEYYYQFWSYNETDIVYSATYYDAQNTTEENIIPSEPTSIEPNNEAYGSVYARSMNLSVSDGDSDMLTVRLFWEDHTQIYYNTAVSSGGDIGIALSDYIDPDWLEHDTNYTWYATIYDGFDTFNTSTEMGLFWFETSKAFDINEDGEASVDDVSILVFAYGDNCNAGAIGSDIIEDGIVNIDDVSSFVSNYGWSI